MHCPLRVVERIIDERRIKKNAGEQVKKGDDAELSRIIFAQPEIIKTMRQGRDEKEKKEKKYLFISVPEFAQYHTVCNNRSIDHVRNGRSEGACVYHIRPVMIDIAQVLGK